MINHRGEVIDFRVTAGSVDDRQPVKGFCQKIFGLLVGDKGYVGAALSEELAQQWGQLITPVRRNMTPPKRSSFERYLLQIAL